MYWRSLPFPTPNTNKNRSYHSKEEYISSKAWLSKYGLETLGLRFERLTVDNSFQSNHKAVFKHINHRGDIVELCVSHQGLKGYVHRLQTAVDRYRSRLAGMAPGRFSRVLWDCYREKGSVPTGYLQFHDFSHPRTKGQSDTPTGTHTTKNEKLQHCHICFHCHPMAGAAVQCERRALPRGSSVAAVSEGWRVQLLAGGTQGVSTVRSNWNLPSDRWNSRPHT